MLVVDNIPVKILIVDDREDNHLSLESVWEGEGYSFSHAHSGKEALRILLEDTDFTLIIMDVMMPGMDGFETASFISQRNKLRDIPILFLTARGSEDQVFEAFNLGAVDYISKPVNPQILRAKVNVFIDLSRKNKILESQKQELKIINSDLESEILERKASEKKVNALNRQLSKKLKELEALDSFSYSVSHDFKGPLSNISLITQILQKNKTIREDSQAYDLIKRVDSHVFRLNNLINDLLLFSHTDYEIHKEEVNMTEVVSGVLEEVEIAYRVNGDFNIDLDELPNAVCNPNLIKQVWTNLISNSIKYSKGVENPCIKIRAEFANDKNVFSVIDNGIGFDSGESEKLFNVFERLESAKKFEGSGVGLAIVKRIIDKHGGSIWVTSAPGKGSTFSFYV